jgi:hypothetical protein
MMRGVRGGSNGMNVHHGDEAKTPRTTKTPFLARQMSKWFYDTSTGTATRAARCGSLLERAWLAQCVSYEGTSWT